MTLRESSKLRSHPTIDFILCHDQVVTREWFSVVFNLEERFPRFPHPPLKGCDPWGRQTVFREFRGLCHAVVLHDMSQAHVQGGDCRTRQNQIQQKAETAAATQALAPGPTWP
jgi:hypothetical protein